MKIYISLFVFCLAVACAASVWAAAGMTITWTDLSNNEDGFGVERKMGTTGVFSEVGRTGVNSALYVDSGLLYGQQYCYRIYAYNTAGRSLYSPEGCGITKLDPLPDAPGQPTVTPQ